MLSVIRNLSRIRPAKTVLEQANEYLRTAKGPGDIVYHMSHPDITDIALEKDYKNNITYYTINFSCTENGIQLYRKFVETIDDNPQYAYMKCKFVPAYGIVKISYQIKTEVLISGMRDLSPHLEMET